MQTSDLLLAFYGDDFTGSTDAMEALFLKGYRTVLFLEPPSEKNLQTFSGLQCIGVAGTSRAKDVVGMTEELAPVMEALSKSGAKIVHYKTCSTFDSSVEVGSIGNAIKVSLPFFKYQKSTPVLVGAPALGRYTLFGHHFAKSGDKVYRLDRHPIMSKHPITPMYESDLGLHLKQQINAKIGNLTVLDLEQGNYHEVYESLSQENEIVIHDVYNDELLCKSGEIIWNKAIEHPQFVVGSSGVEYALTDYWTTTSDIVPKGQIANDIRSAEQLLVVSGSASEITKQQIENAIAEGFIPYRIPVELLCNDEDLSSGFLTGPLEDLKLGKSVILFTALGPDDLSIKETRLSFSQKGINISKASERIGSRLGKWTNYLLEHSNLKRLVVAGGDTSGFVTKELGIYALEILKTVSPGAPLCKGYLSNTKQVETLEIALKGGQFGGEDFFVRVKNSSNENVR